MREEINVAHEVIVQNVAKFQASTRDPQDESSVSSAWHPFKQALTFLALILLAPTFFMVWEWQNLRIRLLEGEKEAVLLKTRVI